MGFFLRKSFSLGPIRFNLSKSGVGVSAGVKGARIGLNAKGKKYVNLGRGGIYYRQTLSDGEHSEPALPESPSSSGSWFLILAIAVVAFFVLRFLLQ